jgi:hypothetical protein
MAWIENSPVSLPSKPLVIFVGVILFAAAVGGAGLGVRAVWRSPGAATSGSGDESLDAQAIAARPIVELPPPPQAAPVAAVAAPPKKVDDQDDSNAIAAKTAAAQAVQANPAKKASDIDDILTSSSEKPQPPAKPTTDESAPGAPAKSDVPF